MKTRPKRPLPPQAALWPAVLAVASAASLSAGESPVPPSPVIETIVWDAAGATLRLARGSDNWPLTWGDDDFLYTAYGDGRGFEPYVERKLSLGFARVHGTPPDIRGENIRSPSGEASGDGPRGPKASGLLMARGVLYVLVRNVGNSQLGWSEDRGRRWQWCDWKFTESFGCPTFLNFGRNYEGARDEHVYIYSPDANGAYRPADGMVLARVPLERILERKAYEFFAGLDRGGAPRWSADIRERKAVFRHPGRAWRGSVSYHPVLRRYLWCQTLPESPHPGGPRFAGGFGIYDAPEPWGPWTTVFFTERWDMGPGETQSLPVKWMAPDGRTVYLVFSGGDAFSVRRGTIIFRASRRSR